MRYARVFGLSLLLAAGCASAPPQKAPAAAPVISADQKMSWILRLEDRRILHDPPPPPPVVVDTPPPTKGKSKSKAVPPPPPPPPVVADLAALATDSEPRI